MLVNFGGGVEGEFSLIAIFALDNYFYFDED